MRRPPSALTAIGGFGMAIAALSVATTAGIVLFVKDPPTVRMTVAHAAAALRGHPGTLQRHNAPPPEGIPSPILQHTLARALNRPVSAVRVVWLNSSSNVLAKQPREAGSRRESDLPSPFVFKAGGVGIPTSEGFTIQTGEARSLQLNDPAFDRLILSSTQPPFAASLLDERGHWTTVYPSQASLGGWRSKTLGALAVSLLLLAPLAWLFARRFTRPFRALADAIERDGDLPPADGPRELRDAAAAIVQLRARLAADADERMRMMSAVAHDLRTPLTSLKLRIEGVAEPQRARMAADADRMQTMIHEVLTFARFAAGKRELVDVRPTLIEILTNMPRIAGKMTLSPGPDTAVMAVEQAFQRALENLIRNAVDYAGGGRLDVSAVNGTVVIDVVDFGPGIAKQDRDRLIRPFERGDISRNRDTGGIGLGLSIVNDFATLHGGSFALATTPGGGTTASLRLARAVLDPLDRRGRVIPHRDEKQLRAMVQPSTNRP